MNAERVVEVLKELRDELVAAQVDTRLQQIDAALQQVISQPAAPQFQSQMVSSIDELRASLQEQSRNGPGAVWVQAIQDLKLEKLLPLTIDTNINELFQRNQLTPAVAQQNIREMRDEIVPTLARVTQVLDGLASFGINEYKIPADKAEIGVLIPRSAVDNDLGQFGDEAKLINRVLLAISEAASGSADEIKIQSVSTSDILVYVLVGCTVAEKFASILSKLVGCYERILRVRALSEQLKVEGLTDKQLTGPKQFAEQEMKKCIDETVDASLKSSNLAAPRKHELRTILGKALWNLAQRLDSGYNFDVRASDAAGDSPESSDREAAASIKAVRKSLEFLRVEGEPILQLPSGVAGPDDMAEVDPTD